jgi:hypothetical protein
LPEICSPPRPERVVKRRDSEPEAIMSDDW